MKLLAGQKATRDESQVENGVTSFEEKLDEIEAQKEESVEIKCARPQYMIK